MVVVAVLITIVFIIIVAVVLMIIGIAMYIVGGVSFGLQFPKLAPKIFGYHEVWHSFVSVAAVLHFIVVYSII